MKQEEILERMNETGESAHELLYEADPKLIKRFESIDKQLIKLLKDVRTHFPDAEYYTASGGFTLMIGNSHGENGLGQPELVACDGRAQIGDGDF